MDERSSLGTVSKRGCFFRNARARNNHVEATLNHPFAAQVCRDAYVKHRGDDDRGEAALADLFRRSVALDDDDEIEAQIAAGVLERVDFIPF